MRMNMHTSLSVHTFEHGYTHTHRICECASECVPMCLSMGMCVCLLVVFSISGTLLVIVLLTFFLGCGSVCLIDDYSAMGTVR